MASPLNRSKRLVATKANDDWEAALRYRPAWPKFLPASRVRLF
jgi:hypothetical protein